AVEFVVLRDLLIFAELGLTGILRQKRDVAGNRFAFDDRKAGFGQPRRPTDDQREHHHRGDDVKPGAYDGSTVGGRERLRHATPRYSPSPLVASMAKSRSVRPMYIH